MSWLFGRTSKPAAPAPAAPPAVTTENDAAAAAGCPVDHSTRSRWLQNQQQPDGSEAKAPHPFLPSTPSQAPASGAAASRPSVSPPAALSHEREVSSIPRWLATDPDSAQSTQGQGKADGNSSRDGNWVYPSPNQFYTALQRKNRNPAQADMDFVVPIHNAVNERTWDEVMKWECGTADAARQDVKLVSFKGRPQDVSPRAWFKTLLGYSAPFDRHDWIIDRNGKRLRYVIDFYTGRGGNASPGNAKAGMPPQLAFYLDVRPAIDGFEGVRMRVRRSLNKLFGLGKSVGQRSAGQQPSTTASPSRSP